MKKRKQFTREFKLEAVRLLEECKKLRVSYECIRKELAAGKNVQEYLHLHRLEEKEIKGL